MVASIFNNQKRTIFRIWPRGYKQDFVFKNYFSLPFRSIPAFNNYFYQINALHRASRFRSVVVRSKQYGYLSDKSIEAFRKVVSPYFRKKSYFRNAFFIHVYPFVPLTKKPAEVRIGGGKGSKMRGYFAPIKPGQILFSIFILKPSFSKKLLNYATQKLSLRTNVFFILKFNFKKMIFINNNSKLSIIDNSGVSKFRVIGFSRFSQGRIGDLCIGSLNRVRPRRKLKKGQIFRSLIVQSRLPSFRVYGAYLRSLSTRSILVKRNELVPVANRLNSFYFLELRKFEAFKLSAMTIYIILFSMINLNYKNLHAFFVYNTLENVQLRFRGSDDFLYNTALVKSSTFSVKRSFPLSDYFNFIRFFNLIFIFFGYFKPYAYQKRSGFLIEYTFRTKFFFMLLLRLHRFAGSSKAGFINIRFFDDNTGFIGIQEPHVAFSVSSPYFDYHNSRLNLKFTFNYKNDPVFLNSLLWLFK